MKKGNMKVTRKLVAFSLTLVMLLTLGGCGSKTASKNSTEGSKTQVIPTEGYLTMLDFEMKQRKSIFSRTPFVSLSMEKYKYQSYASISELLLGLNAGKIDWAYLPYDSAKYVQSENKDLTVAVDASSIYSFSMATRGEDSKLAEQLNGAITALRQDGTLSKLEKQYIYETKVSSDKEVALEKREGVPTVRIGLTGNLPPFDYVSADGVPAGFNVAFANALGEKIGANIELVTVEVDARLTALVSKKIDVVFWMIVDGAAEDDLSTNDMCITKPHHQSYGAAITKDYPYDDILKRFGLLQKGDE